MSGPPPSPRRITCLAGSAPTRLTLFVLPHAGGGAAAYRPWRDLLPADIALGLVHLPGREVRVTEPPSRDLDALVRDLLPALLPHADAPYALFGHSMGARLAYEIARRLPSSGVPPPRRLFVSAHPAPHLPHRRGPLHEFPDARLREELERLGGTPREVLEHDELMALVLPIFRADLEAVLTHAHAAQPRLQCPITVMGGRSDPTLAPADLEAWREQAPQGDARVRTFDGGHFYLHAHPDVVVRTIVEELAQES